VSGTLLQLRGATRRYTFGAQRVYALRGVDVDIRAGETVALMGASGSGKSTLMNVLGCLDRLDEGIYRIEGQDVSQLDSDELAALRRAHFGFVFQRYNLLSQLSALANVEIPAIYSGQAPQARQARAHALLRRLGLGERLDHRPDQLSGGQQQRVSIARAIMNGGRVILADEPTGALDSRSGRDVMALLMELNRLGHTLVIATHDPAVAAYAHRIVELADGRIVSDRPAKSIQIAPWIDEDALTKVGATRNALETGQDSLASISEITTTNEMTMTSASAALADPAFWSRFGESARMAIVTLFLHRLRTALTLLGVVIGIVSVVTMVALGEAAQRYLADELKGLATNTLEIFPGKDWGDPDSTRIQSLSKLDVDSLREQDYVKEVSPQITLTALIRSRAISGNARVNGVEANFLKMLHLEIVEGSNFSPEDISRQAQVVVIDPNIRERFFGAANPIGATIYVGKLPCIVIGVTGHDYLQEVRMGSKFNLWMPYTTTAARLVGRSYLDDIVVALQDVRLAEAVEGKITSLLVNRHRTKDFMVANLAAHAKASIAMYQTMALLLAAIGIISLVVGGIGVMNIMLVSVTERAREIGVRVAVGARQSDIRRQFLIEAVVVCLIGAAIGVGVSYLVCKVAGYFLPPRWEIWLSIPAILIAVVSAVLTGVIFGYAPARNAARLHPVEALARD
jgi:macrolide transport system ATP-binding/permease protein